MSAQLDIREATVRDTAVISELSTDVQTIDAADDPWRFKEPGPDRFTAADAAECMSRPTWFSFIAIAKNEPKGYVVAKIREMPGTSRVFEHTVVYVRHIGVRPDYHGHGIGIALLDAVKQRRDVKGMSLIPLDTWTLVEKGAPLLRAIWSYSLHSLSLEQGGLIGRVFRATFQTSHFGLKGCDLRFHLIELVFDQIHIELARSVMRTIDVAGGHRA